MIERGQFAPHQVLLAAMSTWIVMLLSSLISGAVGAGAVGVPLGRVVDVVFVLQLCVIALFVFAIVFHLLGQLSFGEVPSIASGSAALFLTFLQPFGAIAGYRLYALLTNDDIVGATFAYVPFVMFYATTLAEWGLIPSHLHSDPMVLGLSPIDGPWLTLTAAMRQIEFGLMIASLLFSLAATYLLKSRYNPGT
jgi:hypothetical protein